MAHGHPFKRACGLVRAGEKMGTAYLVAPDKMATCEHVVRQVKDGGQITVDLADTTRTAKVLKYDDENDVAILELDRTIEGVRPMRLAGGCKWKASWDGFGFPGVARGVGIPVGGVVTDPNARDSRNRESLILLSPEAAAGMATPVHGFSGSPVVVEDAVVGHLKHVIQDPGSIGRPAFGLLWATPARFVSHLLGAEPAVEMVEPPAPWNPSDDLPELEPRDYDVFVSYRSTDREWAMELVGRLEGEGFRVFVDRKALVPGDRLGKSLHEAIYRSRAAVIVMSEGWLASPWCQDESNALYQRTIDDRNFRVVPLRIDSCEPPPEWRGRLWLDFADQPGPVGHPYRRLQYALVGREPPATRSDGDRLHRSETEAMDEMLLEMKAAAAANPKRVYALWERLRKAGMPDGAAALLAAQHLIQQGRPDLALQVVKHAREGVRKVQLRALALAKTDRVDEAIEILVKLKKAGPLDAETGGILAGRYKQKWLESGNRGFLHKAFELYRETFDETKDPYSGINAAALALYLGRTKESEKLSVAVLAPLEDRPKKELTHWDMATIGEAKLLLRDVAGAEEWYGKTVGAEPNAIENIAAMRRQARLNLKQLNLPRNALDSVFPVPRVAAFTGHMVDAPDRKTPRFPPSKVGAVRGEIRRRLKEGKIRYGFASAARGSDLLFLEELIKVGGRAQVVLPFPADAFMKTSVGYGWDDRFARILKHDRVTVYELADRVPAEDALGDAFDACGKEVNRQAVAFAKLLEEESNLVLLAVWDGRPGDGKGGTADTVKAWLEEGYELKVIDVAKL